MPARAAVLAAVLATVLPAPAAAIQAPAWAPRVDSAVARVMAELRAPAVSIAIIVDSQLAYARGYGLADVEGGRPASDSTLYRTASLAKPITATAVLQLVEDGRIGLDAPVSDYCPAFPPKRWPVTVRQLLEHRGGIRHPTDAEDDMTRHFATIGDALRVFTDDPLLAEPGTRFSYSSLGYMLLGCAIEGASGLDYVAFLESRVFRPAGMTRTTRDTVSRDNPLRSRGYRRSGNRVEPSLRVDTSFKLAGGGLVSNVVDLARFGLALLHGRLLMPASLDTMWTPLARGDGNAPFGLGWQVSGGGPAGPLVYHVGQQQEVTTIMLLRPRTGYGIVVMTNLERLDQQILRLVTPIRQLTEPLPR